MCSDCPEWRLECEAKEVLRMPIDQRREALSLRDRIRGKFQDKLRDAIKALWEKKGPAVQVPTPSHDCKKDDKP